MRIAIDCRWIFDELSGVGIYTRELLRHYARDGGGHTYVPIFRTAALRERTLHEIDAAACKHLQPTVIADGVFAPLGQVRLPCVLRRERIDCFHSTNYMIPMAAFPRRRPGRSRAVVTIHDVIPLLMPDHAPRSRKTRLFPLYRALMREITLRADRIITVSHASAADIARVLCLGPAAALRLRAIHNGVDARFQPPAARAPRAAGDAPRRLLYVGRSDPYKNLTMLIEAFAALRREMPFPVRLTIAGSPDPRYPEAGARAEQLGVAADIAWTGYLADDALVRQYQEADLLVHPSRYEGFGLQVVEAMACGLPVVCSTGGALPEVAGDAARLVAPDDTAGWVREMAALLTDDALRDRLSARGRARAAGFTWRAAAEATRRVYEELAMPAAAARHRKETDPA